MVPAIKFTVHEPDADGDIRIELLFFACCVQHAVIAMKQFEEILKTAMMQPLLVYYETAPSITDELQTELVLALKRNKPQKTQSIEELIENQKKGKV